MSANVGDLTVRMGLEVDGSKGVEQMRAQIRALEREPDPKLGLDTRPAETNIQRLTQRIESLSRQSNEVRVGADTTGAERSVGRLDEILSRTTRAQYTAQVSADIDQALGELGIMQAQLSRLDDRPAHVEVRAETDQAIRDLQALRREMGMVEADTVNVSTRMAGMSGVLSGLGKQAVALGAGFGIAQAGMNLIGRAADFLRDAVWGANISLEQVTIRVDAFTRDAAETQRIFDVLRQKATDLGIPFLDLANVIAGLGPIAKQTDQPLMQLLDTALQLAAANPAEGLEGAMYAIREALSGDWMSLIDRFNMPRQIINQMKEEGVPALQIINQLLTQQGYDMDYVARMATVADSRTRTLFGNLRLAAGQLGRPAFEAVSGIIDKLASYTSSEAFQNDLKAVQDFGQAIRDLPPVKVIEIAVKWSVGQVPEGLEFLFTSDATPVGRAVNAAQQLVEANEAQREYSEAQREAVELAHENASAYQQYIDTVLAGNDYIVAGQQELERQAEAYHFQQQQLEAQVRRTTEARRDAARDASIAAAANADAEAHQRVIDTLRDYNVEAVPYIETLSAEEQMLYRIAYANSRVQVTQDRLGEAYQQGLQIQQDYSSQASEYQQQSTLISQALDIQKKRLDEGKISQEEYNAYVERATSAMGRYTGGVEDATLTAGEYAIQNAELMGIQDQINAQYPELVRGSEEYNQKLREAAHAAGISDEAVDGMLGSTGNLTGSIANELVPAIRDLIAALQQIEGTYEANVRVNVDASQLEAISGRFPGVSLQAYAEGGVVDRPTIAMIGEDGPEVVLPLGKPDRMRELLKQAGMPMWADGGAVLPPASGGDSGGGAPMAGTIDWSFLFAGLDVEAEDYAERATQAFVRMFDDIESLVNGDALEDARQKLQELFTLREIAIATGAGEAVISGLDAQIAEQQARVTAIGAAMGSEVVAGMVAELASAEAQQKVNDALAKTIMDIASAGDPYQKVNELGQKIRDLREAIALAEAAGNTEVADQFREQLEGVQSEYLTAQNTLTTMLQQGMLDEETIRQMAERGGEGFRRIYDTVFGEGALAELQAGWQRLSDEQYAQLSKFVEKGGELSDGMVASIIDGITSGALDVQQAMQLLGDEQGKLAADQQKQLYAQLQGAEQQLMQALASGDQARIAAAQENYDALMQLIQAYAAATGRSVEDIIGSWGRVDTTLRNTVTGQIIKPPSRSIPSMSAMPSPSGGFGSMREAPQTINLQLTDGRTIATWVAYDIAREVALAPSGVGGIG